MGKGLPCSNLRHRGDVGYTVTESFCKLYAQLLRKVRKLFAPLLEIGLLNTVVVKALCYWIPLVQILLEQKFEGHRLYLWDVLTRNKSIFGCFPIFSVSVANRSAAKAEYLCQVPSQLYQYPLSNPGGAKGSSTSIIGIPCHVGGGHHHKRWVKRSFLSVWLEFAKDALYCT